MVCGVTTNDAPTAASSSPQGRGPEVDRVPAATEVAQKPTGAEAARKPKLAGSAKRDIVLYGLARLGLFIVLAVIIHTIVVVMGMANFFPLLISMMLALLVALPLSMVLFKKLRVRTVQALAQYGAEKRAYKQQLRDQLEQRFA